ncbi:winged helix-turn-helix domain-containing protein [Aureimonas psammosilenae]|uniref:winged helix-turn-helix domain-containing protein n=1 Tax=Aureimonas psammosilenae TaxID=2495496 RepID=UPI0038B391EE
MFHRAWQYEDRSLDVLVTSLRRKLEPTGESNRIKSVRGTGYVLNATDDPHARWT